MNATANNDILNLISRYQYSIKQAQSSGTNDKILRYIHKLSKLPIRLKELEKTGVGKTINALRKCSGTVGEEANLLVAKWKLICTKEMEKKGSLDNCDDGNDQSDHDSLGGHSEVEIKEEASSVANCDRSHSKKKSRHSESNKTKIHLITIKKDDRKRKHSSEIKDKHAKKEKYRKLGGDDEASLTLGRNDVPKICENGQLVENNEPEQFGNVDEVHETSKPRKKEKENEKKSHKKEHEKRHHKSSKHNAHRDSSSKQHRRHSKSSHHDKKDGSEEKSSHKHREKEIKKLSDNKDEKRLKSKNSSDSSVDCEGVSDGFVSENNEHFDDEFGAVLMGIPTATSPKKKSPSSKSTTRRDRSPSSSSSPKQIDDIDCLLSSNAKLEPLSEDLDVFDGSYSFSENISRDMKIKHDIKDEVVSPNHNSPREKSSKPKPLSEEEMFSCMTSTKNQRTKVFSGLKSSATNFKFPTLFELCVRVLQDNFNALEYTGGIPYDLLKPILEKVTADQLFTFENYNPYLIGETDELWQFHATKHFRKAKLQENESWRDLYLRCVDERQEKLQSLTENISQAMANSAPVRKTKLTYWDSQVKPPRNVARIQLKHGTSNQIFVPKKSKEKQPSPTAVQSVKERLAKDVCSPNAIQIPTKSLLPPKKKAPLMQKTLRLFKGLNKR